MNYSKIYENCSLCPRNCHIEPDFVFWILSVLFSDKGCPCCPSSLGRTLYQRYKRQWGNFLFRLYSSLLFLPKLQDQQCGLRQRNFRQKLARIFLELQNQGAHNINLVTATQYLPSILNALDLVKNQLKIPIVYNSSGYEKPETIRLLKGYVDIYLPDLKYFSSELSRKYSKAEDYFEIASCAIKLMIEQTGAPVFDSDGMLQKGVIIRHLVLPNCRKDSITLLHWIKEALPDKSYLISLLSQYTPFYKSHEYPELNRRITTYEYESVLKEAISLGLVDGFMQEKSSAKEEYTPPFNLEGL